VFVDLTARKIGGSASPGSSTCVVERERMGVGVH
jgi:hypothetical protein